MYPRRQPTLPAPTTHSTSTHLIRRPARAAGVIALAVALSAALFTAAPGTALGDRDPKTVPRKLDVPPDHPWRVETRLALSTASSLPGATAARGRQLAIQNLVRSSPPVLREHVKVGPLHGDRFTLSVVGDQACAIWRGRSDSFATPGPCQVSDRIRLRHPLQMTADVVTFLYDDTLADARNPRQRRNLIELLYKRSTFANIAWTFAPHGVGIAGFIDRNHDGLDDDARFTVHGRGQVRCVRFAVYADQKSGSQPGICREIGPRRIDYPGKP